MYCTNCGKEVTVQAVACPDCGVPPRLEKKYCPNCASPTQANQAMCTKCGTSLVRGSVSAGAKNKLTAGLLAIFLGWLGFHKFYLGYTQEGLIMLLLSLVLGVATLGVATGVIIIISIIEAITYFTKSDEEFHRIYVQGRNGWF
jgi:TM2 domain-containing membrane protein YozV